MTLFNKIARDLAGDTTWLFVKRIIPIAIVGGFLIVTSIFINFGFYL